MATNGLNVPFNSIPSDWEDVELGEVATSQRGLTYTSSDLTNSENGYAYFNLKSFTKEGGYSPDGLKYYGGEFRQDRQVTADDLLIANTDLTPGGDVIGAAALVPAEYEDTPALASHHVNILRLDPAIDETFLYYLLCTSAYRDLMRSISAGTTVLNLDKTALMKIHLPMPRLPEQRRIAEVLDAADEAIRQTERVIAKLREVKKGLLHDLLTRGLDAEGNLRDPEAQPELFKDSPLGRIPREWEVADIQSLGTWSGGSTPSKSDPANWDEGQTVWLSPKDMRSSRLSTSEDKITEHALNTTGLNLFDPGDVVVVFRSGILRHAFPVAVTDVPFTVNQDLKVLSPGSSLDNEFVFWLLTGIAPLILGKAVKAGTTVESIDPFAFYHLPVAIPPSAEQRRIASALSAHDALIRAEETTLEKLRQVKRGLMDDLLTGRVRV